MKSIKSYSTTADYSAAIQSLPDVYVAMTKDDKQLHFGGMKKVINNVITEDVYGKAVFDVFREQGWIDENATVMTKAQAASITSLNLAFLNNTEIEDGSFLQYFTSLTSFAERGNGFTVGGFNGCTNLKKVIIPNVPLYAPSAGDQSLQNCTSLEYIEFAEGITVIPKKFGASAGHRTNGTIFVFPTTLTTIEDNNLQYCGHDVLDLKNTSLERIGTDFIYYPLDCEEIYFPSTLTSLGNTVACSGTNIKYVEFNSTTSLSIGDNCFGRDKTKTYSFEVFNFKNNIPITIGNNFGFGPIPKTKTCRVIFHSTTVPTIGSGFFNETNGNNSLSGTTEIYVPAESINDYKAIANLSNFVDRIYAIGGTEWTAAGLDQYE